MGEPFELKKCKSISAPSGVSSLKSEFEQKITGLSGYLGSQVSLPRSMWRKVRRLRHTQDRQSIRSWWRGFQERSHKGEKESTPLTAAYRAKRLIGQYFARIRRYIQERFWGVSSEEHTEMTCAEEQKQADPFGPGCSQWAYGSSNSNSLPLAPCPGLMVESKRKNSTFQSIIEQFSHRYILSTSDEANESNRTSSDTSNGTLENQRLLSMSGSVTPSLRRNTVQHSELGRTSSAAPTGASESHNVRSMFGSITPSFRWTSSQGIDMNQNSSGLASDDSENSTFRSLIEQIAGILRGNEPDIDSYVASFNASNGTFRSGLDNNNTPDHLQEVDIELNRPPSHASTLESFDFQYFLGKITPEFLTRKS